MNTHRAVRQFLAKAENKTELKSERVELNVVQDIDKSAGQLSKAIQNLADIAVKAKQAEKKHEDALLKAYEKSLDDQDKLRDKLKKQENVMDEAKKAVAAAEKGAKALGLDANQIPNYEILVSFMKEFPSQYNDVNNLIVEITQSKI
tara:strand:- start:356 stop:796 length:441 start_codon:yes stop_codon:yes gene_type:complete